MPGEGHPLFGSGPLADSLAAVDWRSTALGPIEQWPASLRNVVRLMLGSRFAMWMAWGPELTFFCNDAYRRDTLGAKYPWALGRPASEVWSEIWDDIGPRIESVMSSGVATWDEGLMLFLERSGYTEETYHTFSYSPITDDAGRITGMLCVVSEESARVIGERRMATLRDLGSALAAARTRDEVFAAAERQLSRSGRSLPFCLGYLFDADRAGAELAWASNAVEGSSVAPRRLALTKKDPWPAAELAAGRSRIVDGLPDRFVALPVGDWDEPPLMALVTPLVRPDVPEPFGFVVAALNRYRALDAEYRGFIELVTNQIAAAINRAQAFEEERRRAEDLAELDKAKTTFFTNVSHELRTPLTLLLGPAADALRDRADTLPATQRARVEVIQRNAERLLKLVNTLLDFSRMQAGQVQARFEPLDLAQYTAELACMFESATERAGLELRIETTPLPERVHVDREMWAKIVLNLVSNALKATFTGSITVRFGPGRTGAVLSVTDTGIGIPPEEQGRLFERFHRVSGAALRSYEGSGIGLALVAELVSLHGGEVTLDSTPGQGSAFTVCIPYGTAHLPTDQVSVDFLDEVPETARYGAGYLAEADRWLAAVADEPEPAAGAQDASRPHLLVVDDNADMRRYVSGLLEEHYRVEIAVDGQHGLELARSTPFDLVITDVMMPRLDGFGLLTALRSDPGTMHVPVMMLSARSGEDAAVEGLEAGADDYLIKPFSARELLARVRANLELDRVRRVADELARSRILLDQAEELAHVGSWELDLRTGAVTGSPEYFRILGVNSGGLPADGLAAAMEFVLEEDREMLRAALERAAGNRGPLDIEVRVARDDSIRLVRAHGIVQTDADGHPVALRGSAQDITDQREAEVAVAASTAAREAAAREHAIAEELQRSLLPGTDLADEHLDIAAYYRAGVEGTQAGGDWYDAIALPDGRTALVIGDVMGRGVRAAAVMGQLRATVRAYARLDLPAGELLRLLDQAVREIGGAMIVTCVYAVHDPHEGTLTYANAGHLPPLLRDKSGDVQRLDAGGPPLGTGEYAGSAATVPWPAGSVLCLYTDGLVEHRGSDLEHGITRLGGALSAADSVLESVPGRLVDALLPHEPDDDVAVLTAVPRAGAPAPISLQVPSAGSAVASARRATEQALDRWGVATTGAQSEDFAFEAALVVSELVTNAVRHGRPPVRLALRRQDDLLVIEVSDGALQRPRPRRAEYEAHTGRGLQLVASVTENWGQRPIGAGKAVWAVLRLPPDPAAG